MFREEALVQDALPLALLRKEGITISYLAHEFRDKMEQLSCNPDEPISQFEFQKLLLEPDIALILAGEGVDVIALVDSLDMVYEDVSNWARSTMIADDCCTLCLKDLESPSIII